MDHRKLYYADSHLKEFSATVTGCTEVKGNWAVTLDATAFYPTGGGQNCDLGTLGAANVLDVKEQGEDILHLCDAPLEVGSTVEGAIDWQRADALWRQIKRPMPMTLEVGGIPTAFEKKEIALVRLYPRF